MPATAAPPVSADRAALGRTVQVLKVLGSEVRVRVLMRLEEAPVLAATLSDDLGITREGLAQHLAILKNSGFIEAVRVGHQAEYSLTDKGRRCLAAVDGLDRN